MVSVPASAPSVLEVRFDGVAASWVILDRSSAMPWGVAEPFWVFKVSVARPPGASILPEALNVSVVASGATEANGRGAGPASVLVAVTPQVLLPVFSKCSVYLIGLP